MKPLIISADDFAQSPAIDGGILDLIKKGRLTATSCLTMSPHWPAAAKNLTPEIRAQANIGLHLDFTLFGQPLRLSLPAVMLKALGRQLPASAIRESIRMQLTAFEHALGTPPDYIDGHQHVHQLPQIRDELIAEVSARYQTNKPWIRISKPMPPQNFKAKVIDWSGADRLKQLCTRAGLRTTDSLAGIYDYTPHAPDYLSLMESWCKQVADADYNVALMCHPALKGNTADQGDDPIYPNRVQEYAALNSDAFLKLLQQYGIRLVRGDELDKTD